MSRRSPGRRAGAFIRGADHNAVRVLEVADRRTFAQEFRIGSHGDVGPGVGFTNQPLDFVAGADRHGRFGDDHGKAG